MLSQIRRISRWVMLPAVTLAFFLITTPVLAEGEAPPEPTEGESILVEQAAEPIMEEGTVEEPTFIEPVPLEPVVMDPPADPAVELPIEESSEVVAETPPITEVVEGDAQDLAEITAALAENDLVISDTGGEALNLASEATAELIASTDPYFYYGGIKYVWVLSGQPDPCGSDPACIFKGDWANPITQAITYLGENGIVPTDKKIYVESGNYGENITIDGNDATVSLLTGLTYGTYLRQLNGLIGISTPTQPVITGSLTISNMAAGFTLSNFEIKNAVKFADNTGTIKVDNVKIKNTSGNGLHIYGQKGAVELKNVNVDGNKYSGALLESGTGKFTLKITNSTFNDNGIGMATWYTGLQVDNFSGAITIDGISANRNNGYGAFISDAPASVTIKNSTFNDNTSPSTSNGIGLYLYLDGSPTPVTLENISAFRNTQNCGIRIISQGAVTAKNVRAEGNRFAGMLIENKGGAALPVVVSNSIFSNNKLSNAEGLAIYSYGAVTLTSIRAENNTANGVFINNCITFGGSCQGFGGVTINSPAAGGDTAANVFYNNTYHGIVVNSRGVISLFNFYADENDGGSGVYLNNAYDNSTAAITVNANLPNDIFGQMWKNSASHNFQEGLYVVSNGAVSVSRVRAQANRLNNVEINNWDVPNTSPKTVTVNYVVTDGYDGSAFNTTRGLVIETKGNVTINNITAVEHAYDGVTINTCQYDGGVCLGSGSVTIKSTGSPNIFSGNGYTGISVYSRGSISLYNFQAIDNGVSGTYKGVYLSNDYSNGSGTITIDANLPQPFVNEIRGSSSYGLHVKSRGAIVLGRSLIKNNANGFGAYLMNSISSTDLPVTVRYSEFSNNTGYGLYVSSRGQITLTNVISENNSGSSYGAYLNNMPGKSGVTVNTSGTFTNRFNNNYFEGLFIESNGAVTVTNSLAQGNGNSNVNINNLGALPEVPKAVTLTNVWTSGLHPATSVLVSNYGVYIYSRGTVNLTKVTARDHKHEGIYIWMDTPQSTVTLNSCTSADNGGDGVSIYGMGNVTLNNSSMDNNSGGHGAFIDNCRWSGGYCTGTGGVNVIAPSGKYTSLSNNNDTGLSIYTGGGVTLTNIKAENNDGHGVSVYQIYDRLVGGVPTKVSGNVIVKGIGVSCVINSNEGRGLYIQSYGNVSVSNAEMRHNQWYGLVIENSEATASPTVTLTDINSNFNWNDGGIYVESKGLITAKGIDASDNNVLVGEIWDGRKVVDHLSHSAGEDQWWFYINGAYSVTAVLKSEYFDAYLCLYEGNGSLLACDDNSAGFSNAWISGYGLSAPGDYFLAVRAVDGIGGAYDLTLGGLVNTDYFYTTGIWLDNSYSETNAAVTISPSSRGYGIKTNDNIGTGLMVYSNGFVSVTNGWANHNRSIGLDITNTASSTEAGITLNSVYAEGNLESSGARGMRLYSKGPISLTNGVANANGLGGVEIDNSASTKYALVTVNGLTTMSNKGWIAGLSIESTGVVNLINLISMGNGIGSNSSGVVVDNCQEVSASLCTKNANVTLGGTLNQFGRNTAHGLAIYSGGLISLNNLSANKNTYSGLYIINTYTGSQGVTMKRTVAGMNDIIGSGGAGLRISSIGAVLVEKLKAADSGQSNIVISNVSSGAPKPLTVKTVWVENSDTFFDGMALESSGTVLVDGVKARDNGYNGVHIYTDGSTAPVTVLRSVFDLNDEDGLEIDAAGDMTLGGIVARSNGKHGVSATSRNGKAVVSALYGDNIFNGNGTDYITAGSGLSLFDVYSTISIERVFAWDNSAVGIDLDNYTGSNPGGLIILKNISLARNAMDGLYIKPLGSITINSAAVMDNGWWTNGNGIFIDGNAGLEPNVTISNSRIMGNYGYGIFFWEVNTVTISNVLNIGNDADGDNLSSEDNYYEGP